MGGRRQGLDPSSGTDSLCNVGHDLPGLSCSVLPLLYQTWKVFPNHETGTVVVYNSRLIEMNQRDSCLRALALCSLCLDTLPSDTPVAHFLLSFSFLLECHLGGFHLPPKMLSILIPYLIFLQKLSPLATLYILIIYIL